MAKGKESINCRSILWFLVFFGFAINYMLRINLSLAIIAMVVPQPRSAAAAHCKNIHHPSNLWTNTTAEYNVTSSPLMNTTSSPLMDTTFSALMNTTFSPLMNTTSSALVNTTSSLLVNTTTAIPKTETYENRFSWGEREQELALGGYYWFHWIAQIPGGLLARRYGTKLVFGWANLLTALLGFLAPISAVYHLNALVFIRAVQGLVAGAAWPAMHDMTAKWIPPNERSKFVSAYLGSSVGAAVTYPLSSALIDWIGWEAVFHVTSLIGIIWYVFWYFLAFDSPAQHPRISDNERNYLEKSLSGAVDHDNEKSVPWKAILTSGPLWIVIVAHWGGTWGQLTLMTQAPTYFNYVHGWNVAATGLLSGVPQVMRMIFSYSFSALCDWLLLTKRVSHRNVRKLATFISTGCQGFLAIGLSLSGCHSVLAVIFMIAATAINGAVSAGPLAILVDLSPNYASILLGITGSISSCAGFLSPLLVGSLTNNNQTVEQWRLLFIISALIMTGTSLIYIFFGSSEQQPWNDSGDSDSEGGQELEKLQPNLGTVNGEKIKIATSLSEGDNVRDGNGIPKQ